EVERLSVVVLAEPGEIRLGDFIPVFHRYIQTRALPELVIDVVDYTHVHRGPGVLLIGHEVDYGVDDGEGQLGVRVTRKRAGSVAPAVISAARSALGLCQRLERELAFAGR